MYGYIYLTENLVNGKKYIGQHKATEFEPTKYIGSGHALLKAVEKYGRENFKCSFLAAAESAEELSQLELKFIAEADAVNSEDYYNLCFGGDTNAGYKHTDESRKRMQEAHTGKIMGPHSAETRRKISEAQLGKKLSTETKRKLSEANKGKIPANIDLLHTPEVREKIRLSCLGRIPKNKGIARQKYYYKDSAGLIYIMDAQNAGVLHPDWEQLQAVTETEYLEYKEAKAKQVSKMGSVEFREKVSKGHKNLHRVYNSDGTWHMERNLKD